MRDKGALSGVRVIDLGMITAGAATSQALADFGADVIKVETPTRPDPFRQWNQIAKSASGGLNDSPPFHVVNRNKRGIGIDLKNSGGRQVFLDLVAKADVVVENFRRGVMNKLGLSFTDLTDVNPTIVLVSLGSQGETGPESHYVSFGSTLEAIGGSMSVTGYDDDHPVWTGNNVNFPDQLVSIAAPGAVIAALLARDQSGAGVHLDFSQRESVTSVVGDSIVDYQLTGEIRTPSGNADPALFFQDVVPCAGGAWLALTIPTEKDWERAATVLEIPTDLDDADRQHHVRQATAQRKADEVTEKLQTAGIAAARVDSAANLLQDPQLRALKFFVTPPGRQEKQRGFLAALSDTPGRVDRPAPDLGQDTAAVLTEILALQDEDISRLHRDGAIFDARLAATGLELAL